MNDFEDDVPQDDLDIEISDLEPIKGSSRLSRILTAWEESLSPRRRVCRLVIAGSSLIFIFLVIFSTFPSARDIASSIFSQLTPAHSNGQAMTTATPNAPIVFNARVVISWTADSTTKITPSSTLDPAPQNCPAISQTQGFEYKGAPRVVGSPPVMVIGFGGLDAVITNFKHAQPPEIGWYKRIVLLAETNYAGTVTFRGGDLRNGNPIWFGMKQHNQGPITTFTMIPLNSGISDHFVSDEGWKLSSAMLYIPRAGCYFLMATWHEGTWVAFFSAGR
jgi:hypothetical protein